MLIGEVAGDVIVNSGYLELKGKVAIVAGAATLAACGSASYEYVRNTEARTAFKVPIEWTVFDEATLQGEPAGPPVNTPDPVEWLIGLDGHPSPTVEHVLAQGGYYARLHQHQLAPEAVMH